MVSSELDGEVLSNGWPALVSDREMDRLNSAGIDLRVGRTLILYESVRNRFA